MCKSKYSYWEADDNNGIRINRKRFNEIKDFCTVKHNNKLDVNDSLVINLIKHNNNKYSARNILTKLNIYYWRFDTYDDFINNVNEKINRNILNIDEIIGV